MTLSYSCSTESFEDSVKPSDQDRFGDGSDQASPADPEPTPPEAPTSLALSASIVTGNSPINSPTLTWTNPTGEYQNVQATLGTTQGDTDFIYWVNITKGLTAHIFSSLTLTECTSYYPSIRSIDEDALPSSTTSISSSFYWDNTNPTLAGNLYISDFQASSSQSVTVDLSAITRSDNCQLSHLEFAIGYDDEADGFDSADRENVQSFITASGGSSLSSYQLQSGVDSASFTLVSDREYYISIKLVDSAGHEASTILSTSKWKIVDVDLSSHVSARLNWTNGSGGGGKVVDGGDGSTNAGGNGIGSNDTILLTSYSDIIFADGSGGGGATGYTPGDTGGNGGSAGSGNDYIIAGDGDDLIFCDGFAGESGGSDKNSTGGNGGYGGGGGGGSSTIASSVGLGGIGAGAGGGGNAGLETDIPFDASDASYGGGTKGATAAQSFGSGGGGVSLSDTGADGDGAGDGTSVEDGNSSSLSIDLSATALYSQVLNDINQGGGADTRLYSQTMGSGNDTVIGGAGNDYIFLGNGSDTLIYNSSNDGTDTIYGFSAGASGDQIELRNLLSGYTQGVSSLSDYINVTDDGSDTTITIDIDGTGSGTTYVIIILKSVLTDLSTLETDNLTIL